MPRLSLGLGAQNARKVGGKPPIPLSGLSLWLKADAGVNKAPFTYASQIVISGTSTPSSNGTYTATSVPGYNGTFPESYFFSGVAGREMSWVNGDENYFLYIEGDPNGAGFQSSDGQTWSLLNQYISSVVITGFTGVYAASNGTYNGSAGYYDRVGGGYYIDGTNLYESQNSVLIATNSSSDYSGTWNPSTYISRVALSGATNSTSINGNYDAAEAVYINSWAHANGGSIYQDGNFFVTNNNWPNAYSSANLTTWSIENGPSPAPTGTITNTTRSIGSPTSTTITTPSGSISGTVTTSTALSNIVAGWIDQSPSAFTFTADAETTDITINPDFTNGKPAIIFSAASQGGNMALSNPNPFVTKSVFIYLSPNAANFEYAVPYENNGLNIYATSNFYTEPWGSYLNMNTNASTVLDPNEYLYLLEALSNTGSDQQFYINGSNDTDGTGNGFYNSRTEIVIGNGGSRGSTNQQFEGAIMEIIAYNRVVTEAERGQIQSYLNSKYAIF